MRRLHHTTFFLLIYIGVALSTCCRAEGKYPFMGDWQGRWDTKDKVYPPKLAAQVFPWKGGSYQIRLFTELRRGAPEYVVIEAEPAGNVLSFDSDGWSGTIQGDNFTGGGTLRGRSGGFKMTRVAYESPRLGLKPPKNARVLFNGGSLDEWEMIPRTGETGTVTWAVEGDILKVAPERGNHQMGASIGTRGTFKDFLLHIEFRLPLLPDNTDQRRGNSEVIIEEFQFFEVQVLDSYGLPGYYDECGAIYQIARPKVNMCLMPRQGKATISHIAHRDSTRTAS